MDWQAIGSVLAGAGALVGGLRRFSRRNERLRSRIERDIALLSTLPSEATSATKSLALHIDEGVRELVAIQQDQAKRRTDPYGLIWMAIFLSIAAGAAIYNYREDLSLWATLVLWIVTALFLVFTAIGATVTFNQHPKEDKQSE